MLATAEDTNGAYSCIEELIPHGLVAPPHIHEAADETFYKEGEATFFVEDQPIQATAESFVSIPRDTKHAFQVDSEIVRLINTYVPAAAGFEYIIIETTEAVKARTLPPTSIPSATKENLIESWSKLFKSILRRKPTSCKVTKAKLANTELAEAWLQKAIAHLQ